MPPVLKLFSVVVILQLLYPVFCDAEQDYSFLFNKTYAERSQLFDTVVMKKLKKFDIESFKEEMDVIRRQAKATGDNAVELEVLLGRFEYQNDNDLVDVDYRIATDDSLLRTLDKELYKEYVALIMFDLGNNYFGKKHNYIKAFEYYIDAYNIVLGFNSKDFPDKKPFLVNIGNAYYRLGDYANAKKMLFAADSLVSVALDVVNFNNKNTLGLIYRDELKYDSAIAYFEQTLMLTKLYRSEVWTGIALGNIGITYYLQKNYSAAIPLLMQDVEACFKDGERAYDNAVNSLLILTDIHLEMDSMGRVAEDIKKTNEYIDSTRDKIKHLSKYYPVLAKYYYKTNNPEKAYEYQVKATYYKDSIAVRDNIYQLSRLQHRLQMEKHNVELAKLKAEKQYIEFARNGLIVGVIFIFIIALLFINRQRLKYILRQNQLLSEKRLAEKELSNASKELINYTNRLQEKNALIEKSGHEIEKLQASLSSTEKEHINNEVLQQLYAATILTDDEWVEFKELFEQVHSGFLHRLKEKMPDLSPADTRFIVLSKLRLSNKEMAGILGVQPDSIRSNKHRLRKKYNLSEDDNITAFVDSI